MQMPETKSAIQFGYKYIPRALSEIGAAENAS